MRRYAWGAVASELAALFGELQTERARPAAAAGC